MQGLGWQVEKLARTVPVHCVAGTRVQVPTLEQQATGGVAQGLGLQPLPLNQVPVHCDCGARKQPPAAVQQAPFRVPQGVGLQDWPRKTLEPLRVHRSGLVSVQEPSEQQQAAVMTGAHAAAAQVWFAEKANPASDWQLAAKVKTQI